MENQTAPVRSGLWKRFSERILFRLGAIILPLLVVAPLLPAATPASERPRLIVLADMGNEPDEEQQMLHLLMCSNEVQLEGLLAVSGIFLRPDAEQEFKRKLYPELFHRLIDGYAQVYPNLQKHAAGWHAPDQLRRLVAVGQRAYGMADTGAGKSSPGSQLIIAAVTRPDPRPVHLVINAGSNTLAQALIDYRATHTPAEVVAFVAKLIVFENQAQDDAGAWICHEFPAIHWIRSRKQTRGFGGPADVNVGPNHWKPYPTNPEGQHEWADEHVMRGHGALGELYPYRIILQITPPNRLHFIEGGGTIPWMRLVSPGLTDATEPSWGGWSGRYTSEKMNNVPSPFAPVVAGEKTSEPFATYSDHVGVQDRWLNPDDGKIYHHDFAPIWRWRQAMWNDFQARMDWCVKPLAEGNHHPVAALDGDTSNTILRLTARPGDALSFDASASTDPDGDTLRYSWLIYPEAGRSPYGKELTLDNPTAAKINFTVPADAAGKELHLILEVTDQSPIVPLTAYRRVVVEVGSKL
jgi:hypothetical protein